MCFRDIQIGINKKFEFFKIRSQIEEGVRQKIKTRILNLNSSMNAYILIYFGLLVQVLELYY